MSKRDWFHTSPRGTARERFARIARALTPESVAEPGEATSERPGADPESDELAEFFRNVGAGARTHDLGDESLYLAEELTGLQWSLGGRHRRALALLILATMISVRQGSTRLPLARDRDSYLGRLVTSLLAAGRLDIDVATVLTDIDELIRAVTLDQLIGRPGEYRPLILADGCVYQHRMLWCESRLARRLRGRISSDPGIAYLNAQDGPIDAAIADVIERAPERDGQIIELSDEQLGAVRQALARRFTVISGGPGTGKTAIVVTMLRVLRRLGEPVDAIALAAPTGKAANRMWASIRNGLRSVPDPSPHDRELLEMGAQPRTLHRLLGYAPMSDRYRHHDNNPLPISTLIVDEASMIDLSLMERLLRAIPESARLIVLGDADQLPSVDAGAVLRDLVQGPTGPGGVAVRLTHSYRMNVGDPAGRAILSAARAVNAGDADALLADDSESPGKIVLRSKPSELEYRAIERLETAGELSPIHDFIDDWYKRRVKKQSGFPLRDKLFRFRYGHWVGDDEADLATLLGVYDACRLLTVTRRQNTGSEAINRRLHRRILSESKVEHSPSFYPGEPVIMRRNDYERGLFNGDQGLVVRVSIDGGPQHFQVVFPRTDGFALFRLDALRAHIELAFATTVHKSQGSEFDEVAVILPAEDLPLLTREMLYTGITRARRGVVVVGPEELIRVGVGRGTQRFSGLAEKLRLPRPSDSVSADSKAS